MARTIIGDALAGTTWLALLSFGLALALSPVHSTIKGWSERSDRENTLRVVGAALGLYVGLSIVLRTMSLGLGVFPTFH